MAVNRLKLVGAMLWGRIETGWISMDYVEMDQEQIPPTEPKPTEPAPTEPKPTEPKPTEPTQPTEPSGKPRKGVVKVSDLLRVRSGPGTEHAVVDYLKNGDGVTVTEEVSAGSMVWGKVEKGWISMDYVQLESLPDEEITAIKGKVTVSDTLRVRSGPGTSYTICGYLSNGAEVEITQRREVNGVAWGKIEKGWICLDYVALEEGSQPQKQVLTVTADCLRVRSEAGTGNPIVGYLYSGAKVEILEAKAFEGSAWGRTAQGWVSMDYLK